MEEIERLKQELKEALDKINEIDKELDGIKATESKKRKWKPIEGYTYYYLTDVGSVSFCTWIDDEADNWRYNNLRIFGASEECTKYKNFIEEVNKRKYEFSVEEWEDDCVPKYTIRYINTHKEFYVDESLTRRTLGTPYFRAAADAQYIISNYKEELLKYCFGME